MRLSTAPRTPDAVVPSVARRTPHWSLWLLALFSSVSLATVLLPTGPFDGLADILATTMGIATLLVCWHAAAQARPGRGDVLLAAVAVTVALLGESSIPTWLGASEESFTVPPADLAYALFFILLSAAFAHMMWRQWRGFSWPVLLDGAAGAFGAAAVLALLLAPVLDTAFQGSLTPASIIEISDPLCDLVMVSFITGSIASRHLDVGRGWPFLAGGIVVFAGIDVVAMIRENAGLSSSTNLLDWLWMAGFAGVAVWLDRSARAEPRPPSPVPSTPASAVPIIAVLAGIGVLIFGTRVALSGFTILLASATLVVAAFRTQLAFRQARRITDLRLLSRTDDLTGLPNRRSLYADAPDQLVAGSDTRSALLLLDLDRFKEVNDSLGHDIGDLLLVQVSRRLAGQLRAEDTLVRLGGDEFALLLRGTDRARAEAVAAKLRAALTEPFTLTGIAVQASVSIGIALFPEQGTDLTALMRRADMAMYKAKIAQTGHHVYDVSDDTHGDARLRTLEELRLALDEDQLVLHFQPKVDLATDSVRGVEALVRWNHPSRGLLLPEAFLDLVEESGLMHTLTQLVLTKALDQVGEWRRQGRDLTVAVNISASSLVDRDLATRVHAMLTARDLPGSALMLEVTEEFLLTDRDRARSILAQLRDQGIRIAVDDFGTGYSSLSYLRDLPIDELKLDQSFVIPMAGDSRAGALVASTIDLAHSLGLSMVAEGVEDGGAYNDLVRFGCDQAQGFFMSRPVPADSLNVWLAERELSARADG